MDCIRWPQMEASVPGVLSGKISFCINDSFIYDPSHFYQCRRHKRGWLNRSPVGRSRHSSSGCNCRRLGLRRGQRLGRSDSEDTGGRTSACPSEGRHASRGYVLGAVDCGPPSTANGPVDIHDSSLPRLTSGTTAPSKLLPCVQ
jgi:hypothetical protein